MMMDDTEVYEDEKKKDNDNVQDAFNALACALDEEYARSIIE